MIVYTSDWEVESYNKGNPFDPRNFPICLGSKINDNPSECRFFDATSSIVDKFKPDIQVYFNAKFDLHWNRRSNVNLYSCPVWCCQLAEYYLEKQNIRYPSLEETAVKYGLGHKVDVIATEYWNKGKRSSEVPKELWPDYVKQDVDLTHKIYEIQREQFLRKDPKFYTLFKIACQDLLVLQEMEWNGLIYDEETCNKRSQEIKDKLKQLDQELQNVYPDIPINFGSSQQLSTFLFGGVIHEEVKEMVGFYKTGEKKGEPKYKKKIVEHVLPRLVEPIRALKTEGFFATDEDSLKKLKGPAAKKYVGILLERAKLKKLDGTYYSGLVELNKEMCWEKGRLHGQLNQVTTRTGRLSSNNPNLQNFSGEIEDVIVSRFNE